MIKISQKMIGILFGAILLILFYPIFSSAQSVSLVSEKNNYNVGDSFLVTVKLDSAGQAINSLGGKILIPDFFTVSAIETGRSFISLWTERPNFKNGEINFSGGLPGGYSGADGVIFTFVLKVEKIGDGKIELKDFNSFLNDGRGTAFSLKTIPLAISVKNSQSKTEIYSSPADIISPESLNLSLDRDPSVADGKYFISFFAVDKGTGIARYEVEEKPWLISWFGYKKVWTGAENPQVLVYQKWPSTVKVRAFDQAGNMTEETVTKFLNLSGWAYLIIFLFVFSFTIILRQWYNVSRMRKSFWLLIFLFLFVLPSFTHGATLFMVPSSKDIKVGDTFSVLVNVDSQGVSINAATMDIKFDPNFLSVQSIGYSNSIFSLWAEEPKYSNTTGLIHLSGGLYSPGWIGSTGAILRITFKAKAVGQTQVLPANGSILANDGVGTDVLKNVSGSTITISPALLVPAVSVEKKIETEISTTSVPSVAAGVFTPIISNLPDQLMEGDTLSFSGTGIPGGQILVYIQKGKTNPEITEVTTGTDGKFSLVYKTPVSTGYYKIWARSFLSAGVLSSSSDISYVEVINNDRYDFLGLNITYKILSVIFIIISFLLFIMLVLTFTLHFNFKHKTRKKEK